MARPTLEAAHFHDKRGMFGTYHVSDALEIEGVLWLVTRWLEGPRPNTEVPERIVSLRDLPIQRSRGDYRLHAEWVLESPLSKDVLEGKIGRGRDVIERPDFVRSLSPTRIQ